MCERLDHPQLSALDHRDVESLPALEMRGERVGAVLAIMGGA